MTKNVIKSVSLPHVRVKGIRKPVILIQGGMGIRVSTPKLAAAVCRRGGIGTLSSAGLSEFYLDPDGKKIGARDAARYEVEDACARTRLNEPFVAMNIMVALKKDYKESVVGAIEGGVGAIISGAGNPTALPGIVRDAEALGSVALIPIVSSLKSARTICRKWWQSYGYVPDAIVIEGDKAGGHLGYSFEDIGKTDLLATYNEVRRFLDEFCAEKSVERVPVIVAGGIFFRGDIFYWVDQVGADGVQMGSRFAATVESGASPEFKQTIVEATEDDIVVCRKSPCGLPFRIIKDSPGYQEALANPKKAKCKFGYVLQKDKESGKFERCLAKDTCDYFCICSGLVSAVGRRSGRDALYTIGSRGYLINKIITVDELMDDLGIERT